MLSICWFECSLKKKRKEIAYTVMSIPRKSNLRKAGLLNNINISKAPVSQMVNSGNRKAVLASNYKDSKDLGTGANCHGG